MQVVRERLIHADAIRRRYERRDHEVDVASEEENRHGEGCAEGRVPVVLRAVCVEPDQAEGDEGVYYCEGVGDYALGTGVLAFRFLSFLFTLDDRGDLLEDEVVGISRRRREHNDHGHEPVLE
jgi:hypothetical protein